MTEERWTIRRCTHCGELTERTDGHCAETVDHDHPLEEMRVMEEAKHDKAMRIMRAEWEPYPAEIAKLRGRIEELEQDKSNLVREINAEIGRREAAEGERDAERKKLQDARDALEYIAGYDVAGMEPHLPPKVVAEDALTAIGWLTAPVAGGARHVTDDEMVKALVRALDGEQLKWLAASPPGRKAIVRTALEAAHIRLTSSLGPETTGREAA